MSDQSRHGALLNRQSARVRAEEAAQMRGDSKSRNLAGIVEQKAQSRKERLEARLREAEEALDEDPNKVAVTDRLRNWTPVISSVVGLLFVLGFLALDLTRQTSPRFILVPGTAINATAFNARLINRGSLFDFEDIIWSCRVDKLSLADGRVVVNPPTMVPQTAIERLGPGSAVNLPCTVMAQMDGVLVSALAARYQVTYRTNILGVLKHQQVVAQTFLVQY